MHARSQTNVWGSRVVRSTLEDVASFDAATGTVVVRILYDGLGLAGKTQSLRCVRDSFPTRSGRLYVPEENSAGRTLYFDWLEIDAGHIAFDRGASNEVHPLRVELLTVPGQSVYAQRRYTLLHSADALIVVVDSTPDGLNRGAFGMRFLRAAFDSFEGVAPPLLIQANKQDLPTAVRAPGVRSTLGLSPKDEVVETSARDGEGIRFAFVRAIQRARNHVTALLDGQPASSLPAAENDPEAVYRRLQAAELEHGDNLEGEILVDRLLTSES